MSSSRRAGSLLGIGADGLQRVLGLQIWQHLLLRVEDHTPIVAGV